MKAKGGMRNNVIFETVVKVLGIYRNRSVTYGDTPTGTYQILGWRKTGPGTGYSIESYGPYDILALSYESGEGGKRNGMHTHGSGLETDDRLRGTNGCIRMANEDIKELKSIIDALEAADPEETKGKLVLENDLETPLNYSDRKTVKDNANLNKRKAEYIPLQPVSGKDIVTKEKIEYEKQHLYELWEKAFGEYSY